MGKNSHIEWTNHTFNPWWGCARISPACENCYAERWSKRVGNSLWGSTASRRFFGDKHWNEPVLWNRYATKKQVRERVFCASMADVFEDRKDLEQCRHKLWQLISETVNLDWLLLTKRPQNIAKLQPWDIKWPDNVWIGVTVENQEFAEKRIPQLIKQPAIIRFVSCEPLLGPIDLSRWFGNNNDGCINWVIAGGESGPQARPMNPSWLRNLRDQCLSAKIPFHFKQWGCWQPVIDDDNKKRTIKMQLSDGEVITVAKMNKKIAGRLLDGCVWEEIPKPEIME